MNRDELRAHLDRLVDSLQRGQKRLLKARLQGLASAFPFNEYEYVITFLVDRDILTFAQYEELRDSYVSSNRYLDLFSLAPRIFGQVWGERHLMDLDERFRLPGRDLDPDYTGAYDLWLAGVRVEVKAARAINTKKRGPVVSKALHWGSPDPFWMNYQQLKLDVCDVFVFIGVWVDQIVYWILSEDEVRTNPFLSHQHRGGIEYQIGITHKNISQFDAFRAAPNEVAARAMLKGKRTD